MKSVDKTPLNILFHRYFYVFISTNAQEIFYLFTAFVFLLAFFFQQQWCYVSRKHDLIDKVLRYVRTHSTIVGKKLLGGVRVHLTMIVCLC